MKHFIFLFHIIAFFIGFVGIISALFAYRKYQIKPIKHYILFIAALTVILLEQTFFSYEMINIVNFSWLNILLKGAEYLSGALIIYFLPLFIHELINKEWTKKKSTAFKIAGSLQICLLFLNYGTSYKKVVTVSAGSLLFLIIFYSAALLFIEFKHIKSAYIKRVLKFFMYAGILFLPYMYLDTRAEQIPVLNRLFPYGLLSVPIFYMTWNLLSIYFGEKYFRTEDKSLKTAPNESSNNDVQNDNEQFFESFNITNREKEIILLLIKGYSYNQLAEELIISITTVKTHVHNIYKKAGVKNKIELIHLINSKNID